MTAPETLRDALARIVAARESLAYGETFEAAQILEALEHDIAALIPSLEGAPE
jgi:hypothetical protein